jgi:thiosulfate/3-mercaptopyruvate sulfurtransferase
VRLDQVAATSQSGGLIWDTREDREYTGATPYGEARGGHIPGAVGLWYGDLLATDGTLLAEPELRALLIARGIRPDRSVITACTGGVRSGFAYAVLRDLGYPQVANYDGSMWEWSADRSRTLTTARSERP